MKAPFKYCLVAASALAALLVAGSAAAAGPQLVLTSKPVKTFAEAVSAPITSVKDGDPVFVAIKTPKPLMEYASRELDSDNQLKWYELHIAVGPANNKNTDFGAGGCYMKLPPAEAAKTEIVIGLAPGSAWTIRAATEKKSMTRDTETSLTRASCFLETVSGMTANPGRWQNRISLRDFRSGSPTEAEILANADLVVDVSGGFAKYNRLREAIENCSPKSSTPMLCTAK